MQDLTDPARNPWLRGRQLWLQIIVRGFWHPAGHLGEYYLRHGQPDRAVASPSSRPRPRALARQPMARGMASYNLACAQAGAGLLAEAAAAVRAAVALNPGPARQRRARPATWQRCATAACSPRYLTELGYSSI